MHDGAQCGLYRQVNPIAQMFDCKSALPRTAASLFSAWGSCAGQCGEFRDGLIVCTDRMLGVNLRQLTQGLHP